MAEKKQYSSGAKVFNYPSHTSPSLCELLFTIPLIKNFRKKSVQSVLIF